MARKVFIKSSFKVLVDNFRIPTLFSFDELAYAYGKLGLLKFIIFFIVCFLKSDEYNSLMVDKIVVKQNALLKAESIIKFKELKVQKRKSKKKNNKNLRKVIKVNMVIQKETELKAISKLPGHKKESKKLAVLLVKKKNVTNAAKLRHKKCPSRIRRSAYRAAKFGNIFDMCVRKGNGIVLDSLGFGFCRSVYNDLHLRGSKTLPFDVSFKLILSMKDPQSVVDSIWYSTSKSTLVHVQAVYTSWCIVNGILPILDFQKRSTPLK
jgi:hypothetical protein